MRPGRPKLRGWVARRREGGRGGFTLIEMIAALTISTLILAAGAGLFVTAMQTWERGSRRHELLQAGYKTADLIERHLRSALKPGADGQVIFSGEDLSEDEQHPGHRLTLVSGAPARFPRSQPPVDSQEVTFEFDPLAENAGFSIRVQTPTDDVPDDGGYALPLSRLVQGFGVRYFDGAEWSDSWSGEDLPLAVEFTLLLAPQRPPSWAAGGGSAASGGGSSGSATGEGSVTAASSGATAGAGTGTGTGGVPQVEQVKRLVWMPLGKATAVTGTVADEETQRSQQEQNPREQRGESTTQGTGTGTTGAQGGGAGSGR